MNTNTEEPRRHADELYEHRHDPGLAGEEVDLKPAGQLNMVLPVRFRGADADAVTQAAEAAGMPVSTFIRQAAFAAARSERAVDREAMARQLDTLSHDLDQLRQHVTRT